MRIVGLQCVFPHESGLVQGQRLSNTGVSTVVGLQSRVTFEMPWGRASMLLGFRLSSACGLFGMVDRCDDVFPSTVLRLIVHSF